jgi:succinoglycan biosynthesis transport protein ExoP
MNLTQFLQALRARRKAFIVTLVAVIASAVTVLLVMPKKYEATATLLMDARDEQVLSPTRLSPREHLGYIATQVDLIQSGRVAAQVARDLKLAHKAGMREAWQQETSGAIQIDDWIAQNLLEKLKADVSASNVVTIKYASSDPEHASAVANGFAKAYLETVLEMRTKPSREAAAWLDDQLKTMRAELHTAQTKLTSYQRAKGITFADERSDVATTRLAELSAAYAAARSASHEAQIRYKQAQEVVASGTPDAMSEIMGSTAIVATRADLTRAEAAFNAASADLGPNHPVYQRHEGEVKALREKLNGEMKKVVASLGSAAQQTRQREEDLAKSITAQNNHIQMMKDARAELAAMSRDVENAQRGHDTVLARFMTNKIESTAKSTNVAMLTPAVVPITPTQPKVPLISGLAVLVGLMLAAAVVYVLETADRRVRSRADLESRLAVPSLGRLSKWQPIGGGRLLPAPMRAQKSLPHPW